MEYQKLKKKNYTLHLIKNTSFKTITVRVSFKLKLEKNEITLRNVLLDTLNFSTLKYPTKRSLIKKCQDLYGLTIYTRTSRMGQISSIDFYLNFLEPKYTEESMLSESIKLLFEVILNPNVNNNKFDEKVLEIVKKNNETAIDSIKDDPSSYSIMKLIENLDDFPYNYLEVGYKEDLEKINVANLYEFYKKVLASSKLDIYAIGNIDFKSIEENIDSLIKIQNQNSENLEYIVTHNTFKQKENVIIEHTENSQSKLAIACKIEELTERERNYCLTLYNLILGGTADSKFFKNIREKHSICYYVNSFLRKLDHLLIIKSGISKDNYEKCLNLIKEEINHMNKEDISTEMLENAKQVYITLLNQIYDSQDAIIETYIGEEVLNLDSLEERKKIIQTITKEEIANISNKIHLDTVYLLEGDE